MPLISWNPLRWDWPRFAFRRPKSNRYDTYISDKIARDIDIDPQTLAYLRHIWPSESRDRPRL